MVNHLHFCFVAMLLAIAKGLYEWVGFHDWDEYIYALSGRGVGNELADHAEMEFVTSVTTLMEPTNPSKDGTGVLRRCLCRTT